MIKNQLLNESQIAINKLVASVAQLVEQLTLNQLVVGSNPPRGTILFCKTMNTARQF